MNDWTSGYVTGVDYTYGYYPENNPLRMRLAFLNAGFVMPRVETACELGFGQGLSINFHAAAGPAAWWGTDFMAGQVRFARELATASGADVHLYDQSFAEFCGRTDLPAFDFIAVHGIWSWISAANRAAITDFVARKLNVGGVLYLSYNTMPGWAPMGPVQHLLSQHAEVLAARGAGPFARFGAALDFADRLFLTQPGYVRANPSVPERVTSVRGQDRAYATHEYLCREWAPMHFAEAARELERARLTYACSAFLLDHIDALNVTAEQQQMLREIPDDVFRETVRDFMMNQQFRRDYWIKGARRLSPLDRLERVRREELVLTQRRADVALTAGGALGTATLHDNVYGPILAALSDNEPKTIAHIEQAVQPSGIALHQVVESVMVLAGTGVVQPAQDAGGRKQIGARATRLNAYLLDLAKAGSQVGYLVSPVTGGGIGISKAEQLLMVARAEGHTEPAKSAQYASRLLEAMGSRVMKDGKPVDSADENIAHLTQLAIRFAERLPVLEKLEIA